MVFEADRPGCGQSAGPGRIFRHLHDLPELVGLAVAAREAWRAAEERFGRPLLDERGTLMLGGPREAYAAHLAAAGVPCEPLGAGRLPQGVAPLAAGLLDPGGGTIDAEGYMDALAAELAPAIRTGRVVEVREGGRSAVAVTAEGPVAGGRVLVCAGAATPGLVAPLGLKPPVAQTAHRRVAVRGAPAGLPCMLDRSGAAGAGGYVTALAGGGLALGTHAADDLPDDEATAVTRRHIERLFPGIDATLAGVVRCRSTVLAGHTEAFGLYEAGPVAAFVGGNLFKHAPALGPLLADAVLEGRVDPLLAPPPEPPGR